jgi:hypothetical protein
MRRVITAGVALAAVGAAIVAAPAGARPSHSVRVTTFSVVEHVRSAHRRGNTFITRGVLTEPGSGGTDVEGFDKVEFTPHGGTVHARGVFFFPDGKLKANGDLRHRKLPIVGGTRRWNGASGKLKFRPITSRRTLLTFTVVQG